MCNSSKNLEKMMDAKRKRTGFTLVELLTVLAIITMLLGLLVPSMVTVRRFARETKQRAQITTMDLALTAFRDEYGEYPESVFNVNYGGAQKLTEALLGWDLLGFHPDSAWRADGFDVDGGDLTYDPLQVRDPLGDGVPDTLTERRGPYLELGTRNAFQLGVTVDHDGLFVEPDVLDADTFVICDVFGVRRVTLANGRTVTAGTPILYYRANTSSRTMAYEVIGWDNLIYDASDNQILAKLGVLTSDGSLGRSHRLYDGDPTPAAYFYSEEYKILDPKASDFTVAPPFLWPHRPDSYILISAGSDGEYGTADDITNFGD